MDGGGGGGGRGREVSWEGVVVSPVYFLEEA